jgi:uncharacterized protein (DUF1501 family)
MPLALPIHQPTPSVARHDFVDQSSQRQTERVLVVVFLRGAADGLTLAPPTGDDQYYRAAAIGGEES